MNRLTGAPDGPGGPRGPIGPCKCRQIGQNLIIFKGEKNM